MIRLSRNLFLLHKFEMPIAKELIDAVWVRVEIFQPGPREVTENSELYKPKRLIGEIIGIVGRGDHVARHLDRAFRCRARMERIKPAEERGWGLPRCVASYEGNKL